MVSVGLQPVLARAQAALDRGRGAEAAQLLAPVLRGSSLTRQDEFAVRALLAEAWLLQDDVGQAGAVLGRAPDSLRESLPPAILSALWRLHGRLVFARGDQGRAVAMQSRALKQAEQAHDPRAIGLAHFELARCYKQVGDLTTMNEHFAEAASALHAVGDRRNLALVHSLSGSALAQAGRFDAALTAYRQAERLAQAVQADDVLAIVCGNQANVAMLRHRYERALELAERSVTLHEQYPAGHGLAVALATLGQICIRLGAIARGEQALRRALDVRRPFLYHETTGAIFDSLAQIHLIRGEYQECEDALRNAREAYGAYGAQTPGWYDWSLRLIEARLALRRGALDQSRDLADAIAGEAAAPPAEAQHARLIAAEAAASAGRLGEADERLARVGATLDARSSPGLWAECLRSRGRVAGLLGRGTEAYHDLSQSISLFDLLGERYEGALSRLELGRAAARAGARSLAERSLDEAAATFADLAAATHLADVDEARSWLGLPGTGVFLGAAPDADDAVVRRLVDAAALPELLARETSAALLEVSGADLAVVYATGEGGEPAVLGQAGAASERAEALARTAAAGSTEGVVPIAEPLGRGPEGERRAALAIRRPLGQLEKRRVRMVAALARQGFELCEARERPVRAADPAGPELSLEPLVPGFLCASAAMTRVAEQIRRLQGNNLTVLITGESGTGKELVAQAIHAGSPRRSAMFLPYNCTTTTRDLADSQLFGHRRGSFTGAVSDQPGVIRSASGGTLFLDEVGDLPLDVQPKLLRFLEQGEVMPVGDTRPLQVDVRVLAATNADLEQRVAEGRFREDLYYRLGVIRIHVPPLRERREEIPHLVGFFLREASEELGKSDVELSPAVLDLLAQYLWPGNVRQLRNEIRRAVALSAPGGTVTPDMLSRELSSLAEERPVPEQRRTGRASTLASAVEELERDLIRTTLDRSVGNIAEAARMLGLTRRGLYLKLRRLGLDTADRLDTK